MRARKVFLVNLWPILISLTLLIGPKNHVILEIQFQFHHTNLNLNNITSWHFGKLSFFWNWTWAWKWSWTSSCKFHFTFLFNNDSGIFTRFFFSILESTLNLVPVHREMESPLSYDHPSLMEKVCEHQFFGLDPIFEPILTLIVDSRLDWVKFPSRYRFLFLIPLSLNPSSSKITLHCWTRMLKKMTQ